MSACQHFTKHQNARSLLGKNLPNFVPPIQFTLLMWGHIKNRGKGTLRKSRLLSNTKREENRIEL